MQLRRMRFEQQLEKFARIQRGLCDLQRRLDISARLRIVPTADFVSHRTRGRRHQHQHPVCFTDYQTLSVMHSNVAHYADGDHLLFLSSISEMESLHVDLGRLMSFIRTDDNDDDVGTILGGVVLGRTLPPILSNQPQEQDQELPYHVLSAGIAVEDNGTVGYHVLYPRNYGHVASDMHQHHVSVVQPVDAVPLETMLIPRTLFLEKLSTFTDAHSDVMCREELDHSLFAAVDLCLRARKIGVQTAVSNIVTVAMNPYSTESLSRLFKKLSAVRSSHLGEWRGVVTGELTIAERVFEKTKLRSRVYYTIERPLRSLDWHVGEVMADIVAKKPRALGTGCALLFKFPPAMHSDTAASMLKVMEALGSRHRDTMILRGGDQDSITRPALTKLSQSTIDAVARMMIPESDVSARMGSPCCVYVEIATLGNNESPPSPKKDHILPVHDRCHRVLYMIDEGTDTSDLSQWSAYLTSNFHEIWVLDERMHKTARSLVDKSSHGSIRVMGLHSDEVENQYDSVAFKMISVLKDNEVCCSSDRRLLISALDAP